MFLAITNHIPIEIILDVLKFGVNLNAYRKFRTRLYLNVFDRGCVSRNIVGIVWEVVFVKCCVADGDSRLQAWKAWKYRRDVAAVVEVLSLSQAVISWFERLGVVFLVFGRRCECVEEG